MRIPYRRPRHLSKKGAKLIGAFEGLPTDRKTGKVVPYNDPVGHATIGYGHLLHFGNVTAADRAKWKGFSRADAVRLLQSDAERFARPVAKYVKAKVNQPQFDALVSFSFNVGTGWLDGSGLERVLRTAPGGKVTDAVKADVRRELLKWTVAGGRRIPGLARRRRTEGRLFTTGKYDVLSS